MCIIATKSRATIEDLYHTSEDGKAEIVNGEIVLTAPAGYLPGYAGGEIFASLREYARRTKHGIATPHNVGYKVSLSGRESFSPDAAFYVGKPTGMRFLEGARLCVEVRSEIDYGAQAEEAIARKRADYFAAGTLVVWDVHLLSPDVVKSYDCNSPNKPIIYRRGDLAGAGMAVPGWSMPVSDLFPEA